MAAARENAERALVIGDSLAERGRRLDEIFALARAEIEGLKSDADALHLCGVVNPRGEQLKVLGGLALATALMGLPIKPERDHLAPRERTSFTKLTTTWRAGVMNWAGSFLDKPEAA